MLTRRELLKTFLVAGAGTLVPVQLGLQSVAASNRVARPIARRVMRAPASIPGGTLDPGDIAKYASPLVIPPAMPGKFQSKKDFYQIAVRQFSQHILPAPLPETTVWSYGSTSSQDTFNYPAFTIEAQWNRPVQVTWRNQLVDALGNYLPHLLPVDPTLHWANPPGGTVGRDMRPPYTSTPGAYTGPVPMVTHLHGGHSLEQYDGHPEAWYLPDALNIPKGYAVTGTYFDAFNKAYKLGWTPGAATFFYPNDQRATTLWYHDHTLGMTRVNVYAGPAGFYIIRGGPDDQVDGTLPGPAPGVGANPFGTYYEIPIAIQDRSFNADGSLFYPNSRSFFDEYGGPYVPDTLVPPIWNPEFFGNMMVVNGRTWPYLTVERRRYRFRFLNGCNSRFLILRMSNNQPFFQIGAEGGYLPAPVQLNQLLLGPAERADVIVDFTGVPAGAEIILQNLGPDEPFGGGTPGADFQPADPDTTGQVMQFRVVAATGSDPSTPAMDLKLPAITPLAGGNTRKVSLNEKMDPDAEIPIAALLGTVDSSGAGNPLSWMDPVTENPAVGATELWELHNFTEDAHPIHIHLVQFQVVGREAMGGGPSIAGSNDPQPWETGFKDTVIAYPGEITRVRTRFDLAGEYLWHCHIVEHEDNEMMRPYRVGP